ncbi:uncharacterized protein LOC115450881 [Manduca sexta]|uniref:uncharacterized protein LOC115450881 n=3 Tax=Manduca sexta TaxID=7130 RepID=UPI0018902048|nr:uncharacterized protein LOC115450881 [Manduca sexta]
MDATDVLLKIAPVCISGPAGVARTFALLDDGSTVSLIDDELARDIGAEGPDEPLHIATYDGERKTRNNSRRVKFNIEGSRGRLRIEARTVDNLQLAAQRIPDEAIRDCGHLKGLLSAKRAEEAKPRILIGQDNWHLLLATKTRLHNIENKLDKNPDLKERYEEHMEALVKKGYAEIAPRASHTTRTWYLPHFAVVNALKPDKLRVVHDAAAKTKADITEMFMQVGLREEDRDALRYLWRGNRRDSRPPEVYRMKVLIFGASCSPATAIYVMNRNAERHRHTHPEAVEAIKKKHYMDDYLDSYEDEHRAITIATQVRNIHREAHFELRKWTSNSPAVLKALGESPNATEAVEIERTERVLGLIWRPQEDRLAFNLDLARIPSNLLRREAPTKREALKIVMSLFDPLGLVSPITVRAKQLLQEVWRRGTDWDDPIDDELSAAWVNWLTHLKQLSGVTVPRCYPGYSRARKLQLHVFTDASESAYATALYWRAEDDDGRVTVTLLAAKAKVAPLKLTSIPRLELQAAVLGARMAASVTQEHSRQPESTTYWTDSKTTLCWIRTGARSYKPYVAHRIAAIEEHTQANQWRWVPTRYNVADDATRDVPDNFTREHRWFNGPEFLRDPPELWPAEETQLSTDTGEERVNTITERREKQYKEVLPDVNRFSNWNRYVRAAARVLQAVQHFKRRVNTVHYKRTKAAASENPDWRRNEAAKNAAKRVVQAPEERFVTLPAELQEEAERIIIKASQEAAFEEELRSLEKENPCQKKAGCVESVVNYCRQHKWVIRLRPTVKAVVRSCFKCRQRAATPPQPITGDLPPCRLAHHHRPFTYTGLDYFGPLTVTVGRSSQKRYVALFTCLTVRAVHLEVVHSLKKELRNTLLAGAEQEASRRAIRWRFIPPGAPFMGGAWERLVRSVKTALTTVLHEQRPHEETLSTLLAEVEFTVNSRPLTHVSPNTATAHADLRASQQLADAFWTRWLREYLPELRNRREPRSKGPELHIGDVVRIVDGTLPRNTWVRGRICATHPGPDGVTRTVDVATRGGVLRRPVKKIVLLHPAAPERRGSGNEEAAPQSAASTSCTST